MPFLETHAFSTALRMSTTFNVILPQTASRSQIGIAGAGGVPERGWPTLYLLHGLSDDETIWMRRTSIERYVAPLGLAVVMPRVDRSWYADTNSGLAYWTWVSEELPNLCESMFRLSNRREDRFVAGLSMGGYGAFKLGLSLPERYAAAASLSGAVMAPDYFKQPRDPAVLPELRAIFGDLEAVAGSDNDLTTLARRTVEAGDPPILYQCCGTGDFLYDQNVRFRDFAKEIGLEVIYEEHPDDVHEWGYWDRMIQRVLQWLPLKGAKGDG